MTPQLRFSLHAWSAYNRCSPSCQHPAVTGWQQVRLPAACPQWQSPPQTPGQPQSPLPGLPGPHPCCPAGQPHPGSASPSQPTPPRSEPWCPTPEYAGPAERVSHQGWLMICAEKSQQSCRLVCRAMAVEQVMQSRAAFGRCMWCNKVRIRNAKLNADEVCKRILNWIATNHSYDTPASHER